MYQRFHSHEIPQTIKSLTSTTFLIHCLLGAFICLIVSVIILALVPLYLPIQNFIPANLENNQNWPILNEKTTSLIHSKVSNIQFSNISDVRIVDSLSTSSNHLSTTWCYSMGCLRILGQIHFPISCPSTCQYRRIRLFQTSTSFESILNLNLNSTLNTSYNFDFDGFTIVVSEMDGEQMTVFLVYNLSSTQVRSLSSRSIAIDNSSLINITRLVNNSIIRSQMNIVNFRVLQANMDNDLSLLNVTVSFKFMVQCTTNCQEKQIIKLKNSSATSLDPIVINYNGIAHFHNASLNDVIIDIIILTTTTATSTNSYSDEIDSTIATVSSPTLYLAESIFEIIYELLPTDLVSSGPFEIGPITNFSTIDDLTDMMQTTVSNYTNITVMIYNATIEIFNDYSANITSSNSSIIYLLHMIVYYIYPTACSECITICINAANSQPQLNYVIQIRNATLVDISSPIYVMDLTHSLSTTNSTSTDIRIASSIITTIFSVSLSTSAANDDTPTILYSTTGASTSATHLLTTQHHITDHTTAHTNLHTTEHTTTHTIGSTAEHTTVHTSLHTTEHSTDHTTEHTIPHTSEHSTDHTTEHTTAHTSLHTTEHSTHHTTEHTIHHTSEHSTDHTTERTAAHTSVHTSEDSTHHTTEHSTAHTSVHTTEHSTHHTTEHSTAHTSLHTTDHTTTHPHSTIS